MGAPHPPCSPHARSQGSSDGKSTFESVCTAGTYKPSAANINTFFYADAHACPIADPLLYSGVVAVPKLCHAAEDPATKVSYLYGCDTANVTATPYSTRSCTGKPSGPPFPIGELGCALPSGDKATASYTACGATPSAAGASAAVTRGWELSSIDTDAVSDAVAAGVARAAELIAAARQ